LPRYRTTRREGIRYPRRAFVERAPNVTLSRIPRDVEANRHYDLIKQIDVFRNHQTVTSFPRKKFVQKICTNTNDRQPTPKNRRWQLQKRKIIRKGNKRGDLRGGTIVVPRYLREAHSSLFS